MTARSPFKLVAFLCYVPALVLALTSLFLPWVYVENIGQGVLGIEVSPVVPVFVAVAAAAATVLGRVRGARRLASGAHTALGLLALARVWEVYHEARQGHGPFFDVPLSPAKIAPDLGLGVFTAAGGLLFVAGLIEMLRPRGR